MLFAVYDTETTGLPFHIDAPLNSQPRVIEFGGIITDGKEIIHSLEFICNPGIAIEQVITDITGLTNADLDGKPPFSEFIVDLNKYFSKAQASIAHNAAFDRAMLAFDLKRLGEDLNVIAFPPLCICTVEQTFHQYGKRMRLIELYERLVGPYVQKHRSIDDVMILHEVAKKIGVYDAFMEAV
jgi:DNA polymerase III alpha subunit (gram-positive type)